MQIRYIALVLLMLTSLLTQGQFKSTFLPDTTGLKFVSQFKVEDVRANDDPAMPYTLTGNFVALDSAGGYPQPFYLLHLGPTGLSQGFHWYTDSTPFVFAGVYGFASDRDAAGNWYSAGSSNSYQTVTSTRPDGSVRWVRAVHHHDFYDLQVAGNGKVMAFGQDESFLGIHDFSLIEIDTNGSIQKGVMVGTEGFDQPRRFISTPRGWLMAGHAFFSPDFHLMLAEVDTAFNLLWAYTYSTGTRDHLAQDLAALPDGTGYLVAGHITGGVQDSAFLMRISNQGVPQWFRTYQQDTSEVFAVGAMELDTATGSVFLVGGYGSSSAEQPFVLKTDLDGNVQWMKGYGDGPSQSIESFTDVALTPDGGTFAATGNFYDVLSPAHHRIMLVTASTDSGAIPCDTSLVVSTGTLTTARDSAILSQGFVIQYSLPFRHFSSTMQMSSVCSLMVAEDVQVLENGNAFWCENPVRDELSVQWRWATASQHAELTIHALNGSLVARENLRGNSGSASIPLPQLSAGLYLLRAVTDEGAMVVRRIVVQ